MKIVSAFSEWGRSCRALSNFPVAIGAPLQQWRGYCIQQLQPRRPIYLASSILGSLPHRRHSSSSAVLGSGKQNLVQSIRGHLRLLPIRHSLVEEESVLPGKRRGQQPFLDREPFSTGPFPHSKMRAENFEDVLKGKYPGKAHAKRVVELIGKQESSVNGFLYLEAATTKMEEDNDHPVPFRQRRYFYYLTGCDLPDCAYVYDIQNAESILFIPPIDPADVIWSGLPLSTEEALQKYDVDQVKYTTDLNATLAHLGASASKATIYAIAKQVSDQVTFLPFDTKNFDLLKPAIEKARVVKDEYEIALIRKANDISTKAHHAVIQRAKSAKTETELEATFMEKSIAQGSKNQSYHPVIAAGRAAATLHYMDNDATLEGKQNLLIDAGAEWENYASDITRTFPLNGKFTKESREIYDIVLKMQKDCLGMIKAGVEWDEIHLQAHRIAIDGLLKLGVLKGDAEAILKAETSAAFFPHGLGHWLGLDTHDKGGNPNNKDPNTLFRYLRLRGTLVEGGVVTVEPGVYFCNFIIEPYLKDPKHKDFIDAKVMEKYWDVGGVRIEDDVVVTKEGYENLTTTVKEAEDVEALWASA